MVNEATIEAYKAMAKDSECPSMETQIRENLERTCDKFAGNEDKLDRCIFYLEDCASQILDGKRGEALVLARFFTPASAYTWYMLEYDEENDEAFGYIVGPEPEYGYFSVKELQEARMQSGFLRGMQAVERDISVDPKKRTLADLLKAYGEKAPSWWQEKASA